MGKFTQTELGKMLDDMPRRDVAKLAELMLKIYTQEVRDTKRVLDPKVVHELRNGIKVLKSQP
jgi:hypothetical protein